MASVSFQYLAKYYFVVSFLSNNPTVCFGLATTRQYRWLWADCSLAVLELTTSLGGSFADHQWYPGLKGNILLDTLGYGDLPMNSDEFTCQARGAHTGRGH